jgi:TorA maturation chaperone TorD
MSEYAPDVATAREDLCRFLSACYYEPGPEFAEEKLFQSMWVAARQLDADLAERARRLGEAFAADDLQTLMVDYTRLFLGPVEALAKPYEASWRKTSEQSDENPHLALLDVYAEGGLEIDDEFKELPDHVAVELEFLYLLVFASNQARKADNADEALQARFLREHLGAWAPDFSAAVAASAETSFYRELAGLTEQFVRLQADAR